MKTNKAIKETIYTYEGGKASKFNSFEELKRATMSCLLWENEFYEDGVSIAERISTLVDKCIKQGLYNEVIDLLKKVKFDMRLRHCPLWMIVSIFKAGEKVSKEIIASILTRPDDMGELISLYNKDGKKPLPNQMKKGIALSFEKFDEYQLAKWNKNANYKLVDIANICHPKVTDAIDKLVKGTLETPKTWEVLLSSAGSDETKKKDAWLDLINSKKLPDMALLKNIRGMLNVGVSKETIVNRINDIQNGKLLPIDYIRAGQNNPTLESEIENKFLSTFTKEKAFGKTAILIDVSGSMDGDRLKYALALAMIGREMYENVDIYSFSDETVLVPNRRGFALAEAIDESQMHWGTYMWKSVEEVSSKGYDRILVITDEQAHDSPSKKVSANMYIVNVASYNKGVRYTLGTNITRINGFSDKVFDYIGEIEKGL
jgi:hypothetical protein